MQTKQIKLISSVMIFLYFITVAPLPAYAQTPEKMTPQDASQPNQIELADLSPFPEVQKKLSLIEAVIKARKLLKQEITEINKTSKKSRYLPSKTSVLDITLAVWNKNTDEILLIRADKKGKTLKIKTPSKFSIKVMTDNGVNSGYSLTPNANSLVVGVRYPILTEVKIKKTKMYEPNDIAYVPYSGDFNTPDVIAAGVDYLSGAVNDVYNNLRENKIMSRAFPNKLLAEAVDPYLVKSIIIIEHSNYTNFSGANAEKAIDKVLATLAINRENTYNFAVSSAGARGLVQFIPSTYNLIVKKRPELKLISDFKKGMDDHKNAIKAQVALLDSDLASMPPSIIEFYKNDPSKAGAFAAAAYNGGSTRVRRALAYWGDDWSKEHLTEIPDLEKQVKKLASQISSLKKQIKKSAKNDLKNLNGKLRAAENDKADAENKIKTIKSVSLRKETVMYVASAKTVYSILATGKFDSLPLAPAGTTVAQENISLSEPSEICFSDGCVITNSNESPQT